jgi:hypothetical protein
LIDKERSVKREIQSIPSINVQSRERERERDDIAHQRSIKREKQRDRMIDQYGRSERSLEALEDNRDTPTTIEVLDTRHINARGP